VPPDVAISLSNLARLLQEQGRYEEAEPLNRRDLAIKEKVLGPEHPDVALSLNNLAVLLKLQGRYAEAEPLYRRALVIQLKSHGPEHPDVAYVLNNMATLREAQRRYIDAAPLFLRALTMREKALGPDHPLVAASLNNLAALRVAQGLYEDADPLYRRALSIQEKTLGPEHPDVATSLNNLGFLLQKMGRYSEAESLYRRALAIREKSLGPEHPDVAISLSNLAWLMRKTGNAQSALELARRTSALLGKRIPAQVNRVSGEAPERQQWTNEYAQHAAIGTAVYKSAPPSERSDLFNEIFFVAQVAAATSTANALAQMASRTASGDDALAQKERNRQDAVARWRQYDRELLNRISKPMETRSTDSEAQLRARIASTEADIRQLDHEQQRDFPAYRELTDPVPLSVVDAQRLLAPEEGLLSWLVLKDETLLFLVTKDRAELVRIEQGYDQLSIFIRRLRLSTEIPPVGALPPFPHGQAHELYQLILGPMEKYLDGIKHLILVPNGPLQSLSFGMLLTSAAQKDTQAQEMPWLARRYDLTTLPGVTSLRALRRVTKSETGREPFIGFGDPALKGSEGDTRGLQVSKLFSRGAVADTDAVAELQPLPETAEELRGIASALKAPASSIHLGRNATETKVKESPLAQYRNVAFATHGLMAGEFKGVAEPALVFTPPATGSVEDDGLLTASEVAGLKLNADWVILSACNTAAPDGTPGADGFSGLTKAFFYAGARSLLVSHWAVESKSTAEITTRLFTETSKGLSKSEALKMSMMALADQPETSHPAYWAPFVIVGDGR
jgi:CHAT domain-containing protein/Tfp pilus assembly protein PilF